MEKKITYTKEAIEYLAKLSQGGMRDALTMLDKCLAYSNELTVDNVVRALGLPDYDVMCSLLSAVVEDNVIDKLDMINTIFMSGYDLKQFIKHFTNFVLDGIKYNLGVSEYMECATTQEVIDTFETFSPSAELLASLIKLQNDIKWDSNPKARIESWCVTGE